MDLDDLSGFMPQVHSTMKKSDAVRPPCSFVNANWLAPQSVFIYQMAVPFFFCEEEVAVQVKRTSPEGEVIFTKNRANERKRSCSFIINIVI